MDLEQSCLKTILHNKLITDENREYIREHFGEQLATLIKRWWRRQIERISIEIQKSDGWKSNMKIIHGREHGLEVESRGVMNPKSGRIKIFRPYLFGVLHGEVVMYDRGYPVSHKWYRFGKKDGRSIVDEFSPYDFEDYKMGLKHGLYGKWYYRQNCGCIEFYKDGVLINDGIYDDGEYERMMKDTEGMYGDDWNDFSLFGYSTSEKGEEEYIRYGYMNDPNLRDFR